VNTLALRRAALIALLALALGSCAWGQSAAGTDDYVGGTYDWRGADVAPMEDTASHASGAGYVSVLDVLGKLIVALVVAWGLMRALRWWQDNRTGGTGNGACGRHMCVEETLSLGADGRLHLVEVDGRRLLLATHEQVVHQIADLTPREPEPEPVPAVYHSRRRRADGSADELNIAHSSSLPSRPMRPNLGREGESWEARRDRLLAELQEH